VAAELAADTDIRKQCRHRFGPSAIVSLAVERADPKAVFSKKKKVPSDPDVQRRSPPACTVRAVANMMLGLKTFTPRRLYFSSNGSKL
jgi:hypothetical protein